LIGEGLKATETFPHSIGVSVTGDSINNQVRRTEAY